VIGISSGEDLGLGFKTAKGARVNDAVAVALKIVAIAVRRLGMAPSSRMRNGVGSEDRAIR
jgi:hypothetical protein